MTALGLFAEPYAPSGNMGDGGFERLLGAPRLDGLQLVLREAIQNGCDAAKLGRGPRILIRLRTLTPDQVAVFRDVVLKTRPLVASSADALERFLNSAQPRVLEICDYRTTGLGGPTRADRIPVGGGRTDFIDFMRNVGTRRNTDLGGGTYGFGKSSLYRMSRCSTILVDTLAHDPGAGAEARRVMGCHLGEAGDQDDGDGYLRRYTGRYWWGAGDFDDDGAGEPVTGEAAASLWEAVGGPSRDLQAETGASIMILDPDLRLDAAGDETDSETPASGDPAAVGVHIIERVLWNFWPRMLETTPEARRLELQVEVDGVVLETPRPEDCPPLDLFARAMNTLRNGEGSKVMCGKPIATLGTLAISRGLRADRLPTFRSKGLLPSHASHIALMRPAEMVVCYLEGSALPDERTEWAGVFVTSDDPAIEEAFASSEPAAHDAWDPAGLPKGRSRTFVTVGMRRLREAAEAVAAPAAASGGAQSTGHSVAAVASRLGAFLAGIGQGGPTRVGGGGGGGGGGARRRATAPAFRRLAIHEGERTALFTFTVSGRGAFPRLVLTPTIAMDGGGVPAATLDVGHRPRVIGIEAGDEGPLLPGETIDIGDFEGELTVRLSVPDNCAVGLRAAVLPEAAE